MKDAWLEWNQKNMAIVAFFHLDTEILLELLLGVIYYC